MGAKEIQEEFHFNESSFPKICTFWTLTSGSIKESHEIFAVPEDVGFFEIQEPSMHEISFLEVRAGSHIQGTELLIFLKCIALSHNESGLCVP